jgi:glycosyltransferase involved in cell wall biosynthesis
MNKIRILCLHIATHRPSYRYRIDAFLPYWKDYDICFDRLCVSGIKNVFNIVRSVFISSKYDYIWVQRKIFPEILLRLIVRDARLIYDFDDALYVRQVIMKEGGKAESPKKLSRIRYVLERSDIVFAGNEHLKVYADKYSDHVYYVPTSYSRQDLSDERCRTNGTVTIGWIGSNSNMFYLKAVDDAFHRVQRHYPDVRFSLMSGRKPVNLKTAWEFAEWSTIKEKEWLSNIDIGLMPLTDDEWSRGKCAFKLLQYMAYGKPVVASNVGANKSVVAHGVNGFLASNADEWFLALEKLILDKKMRSDFGRQSKSIFDRVYERSAVQQKIIDIIKAY